GRVEGVLWLSHLQAVPFTDVQAELVQGFADQAVVAIENARLVGNVDARDRLLADMHLEQTAVADINLQAAQAPGDAELILGRSVEIASRLLGADCAYVVLHEGQGLTMKAGVGLPVEAIGNTNYLSSESAVAAQAFASGGAVEISDAGDE